MLINDPLVYNEGARMGSIKSLLEGMIECGKTFQDYNANFILFFGGQEGYK